MTMPTETASDIPFDVIVPAAGVGARLSAGLAVTGRQDSNLPKQYLSLLGVQILERTLSKLLAMKPNSLCLVISEQDTYWQKLPSVRHCQVVTGGVTRADSVRAGLAALDLADDRLVLVHDAVRPLFEVQDVMALIKRASESDAGGLLACRVVDTLKVSSNSFEVLNTPDRSAYWHAQTPQAFSAGVLKRALDSAETSGIHVTDESSAIEALGLQPVLVESSRENIKITTVEDLALAEFLLQREPHE